MLFSVCVREKVYMKKKADFYYQYRYVPDDKYQWPVISFKNVGEAKARWMEIVIDTNGYVRSRYRRG